MKLNSQRLTTVVLLLIVLFGGFLRFYQLGHIPLGLNKDETSIGYNAYSILKTGQDEYNYTEPLYFKSFDDYKLPVYIYFTAITIKLFGVNAFSVRFLSALCGTLSILGIFFLTKQVTRNVRAALLSAILLAINPWNLFFSRAAFEVNVATSFLIFGTVFFLQSLSGKKYGWMLFLSMLFFGLSMYTYNSTRIISPVIFLLLLFIKRTEVMKLKKFITIPILLLGAFIAIPMVMAIFTHANKSAQDNILLIGPGYKAKALEMESYFGSMPFHLGKLLFNTYFLRVWQYIKNLFAYFSITFFFITGPEHPINGIMGIGMFHPIELLFIVTGFVHSLQNKKLFAPIYTWLIAIFFLGALVIDIPHPTRHYLVTVPFYVLSGYGASVLIEFLMKRSRVIKYGGVISIFAILLYSTLYYLGNYFYRFPILNADVWRSSDKDVTQFVLSQAKMYQSIIFDKNADFSYSSFLFYGQIDPADYQDKAIYKLDGNLSTLFEYRKYAFKNVDWKRDFTDKKNVLVVTDASHVTPNTAVWKTFYLPTRPVVNVVNGQVQAYPYSPPSYVLIEKHT